jgi:ABC-type Mn2+/Zn2+ transport system ATPase subunit
MLLSDARKLVDSKLHDLSLAKSSYRNEKDSLAKEQERLQAILQAQEIAQNVAQAIQQKAHKQIAGVVTECLKSVFGKGYAFTIKFERKRNRTEAVLAIVKNGHEEINPLDQDSGGVAEVAAFALRMCCICLSKPRVRKLMVMDEPFKSVHSKRYRNNVRIMIEKLSKDFGMQIVLVTGVRRYQQGKVVRL